MPGYRAHLAVALLLYGMIIIFTWAYLQGWSLRIIGCVALCAGALFPDIDIKSKGQHYLYQLYAAVLICALSMYILCAHLGKFLTDIIICLAVVSIAPMLVRHRGITHSPRFIVLLGIMMWIMGAGLCPHAAQDLFFYSSCFVIGALSHVWLDRKAIFF
jgi:LexA-binding, inner membrane-associated putative hydrolase